MVGYFDHRGRLLCLWYIQALKIGRSSAGLRLNRLVGGTACYIAEIVGAILLILVV